MTEPTKEQLDKWKNEYQEWGEDESNPNPFQSDMDYDEYGEACYIAAKKSDFEEIKTLKEQLASEIEQREKAENVLRDIVTVAVFGRDNFLKIEKLISEYFTEKQ